MPTPTIVEVLSGAAAADVTLNTASGTAVDDVLVCIHGRDGDTAVNLLAPTGTAGTWTLRATGDMGSGNSKMKVWTRPVTVAGAQTITTDDGGFDNWNIVYVLRGANPTDPVDGAAGGNGTGTVNHDCPSVSPATADALLICTVLSEVFRLGNYTPPAGMTERTELDNGSTMSSATVALAASGPTGVKTFTFDTAFGWASTSIAIKGSAGHTVNLGQPAETDTAQAVGRQKSHVLGQNAEPDTAQPLSRLKSRVLALASTTDTALPIRASKGHALDLVSEADSAMSLAHTKKRTLALVGETDTALPVTVAGGATSSPGAFHSTTSALRLTSGTEG